MKTLKDMLSRKRRWRVLSQLSNNLFPVVVVMATLLTFARFKDVLMSQSKVTVIEDNNNSAPIKMKDIVWHQLYHGGLRHDAEQVDMNLCDYKNCKISFIENKMQEKKLLPSADAVLFQGGRLAYKPPNRTHLNQVYIFSSIESPLHLHFTKKGQEKQWHNVINWTMTYRTDSDILYKYGNVVEKTKPELMARDRNYSEIFHNKTKDVAWLVSDCKTESLRETYIKKLGQHIQVDVYGLCGNLKTCAKERGQECQDTIARDYKFYLSLENSLCKDYMTEKVYSWLEMDLITVVRGARDYASLLPDGTYVDTSRYKLIKNLALHLKILGNDEQMYTKYLKTKSIYKVESYKQQVQKAYCEICKRLHNLDQYRKVYSNVYQWWKASSCLKRITDLQ